MKEMTKQLTQAAEKLRPGAYGGWAERFAGYLSLIGTGLSALLGGWDEIGRAHV